MEITRPQVGLTHAGATGARISVGEGSTRIDLSAEETGRVVRGEQVQVVAGGRGLDRALARVAVFVRVDALGLAHLIVGPRGMPAPSPQDWRLAGIEEIVTR